MQKIEGMTTDQQMDAYAAAKEHFGLKAKQRDLLDASPLYASIIRAAHLGDWADAHRLLQAADII